MTARKSFVFTIGAISALGAAEGSAGGKPGRRQFR